MIHPMHELRVDVAGLVGPKGSVTVGFRKDGTHFLRPDSRKGEAWEKVVHEQVALVWKGAPPLPPPYLADLVFVFPRPKKSKWGWPVAVDIDKAQRATLDGLTKAGVIVDDRHVTQVHARSVYEEPGSAPGAGIYLRSLAR